MFHSYLILDSKDSCYVILGVVNVIGSEESTVLLSVTVHFLGLWRNLTSKYLFLITKFGDLRPHQIIQGIY